MIPMNNHLIIDFETGSEEKSNCVVFCVSMLFFKWETFCHGSGYSFKDLKQLSKFSKFKASSQLKRGYKFSQSTIDFWKNEVDEKTRHALTQPSENDIEIRDWILGCEDWFKQLPKIDRIWSRGNNMEFPILERLLNDHKETPKDFQLFEKTVHWSRVRDTRTWIEAKLGFDFPHYFCPVANQEEWDAEFLQHHPTDDIAADVMRLQSLERAKSGLGKANVGYSR
jgi:hypothetical protein